MLNLGIHPRTSALERYPLSTAKIGPLIRHFLDMV